MYFQALMMMGQAYASRRNSKRRAAGASESRAGDGISSAQRLYDLKRQSDENNQIEERINNYKSSSRNYIQRNDRFLDEEKYY